VKMVDANTTRLTILRVAGMAGSFEGSFEMQSGPS
jgi:hypothetical protein